MTSCLQLQLGAPLFLCALVIAQSCEHSAGPVPQSVLNYTRKNCPRGAGSRRKRTASAAIRLAADLFARSGVPAPAGLSVCAEPEERLDKMPVWIMWLSKLQPSTALACLVQNATLLSRTVCLAVESEYNAAIAASKLPELAHLQLQSGELASRLYCVSCPVNTPITMPVRESVCKTSTQGSFYYIGAGVGCGIKEAQQVRVSLPFVHTD
jgi:hypothetical protein